MPVSQETTGSPQSFIRKSDLLFWLRSGVVIGLFFLFFSLMKIGYLGDQRLEESLIFALGMTTLGIFFWEKTSKIQDKYDLLGSRYVFRFSQCGHWVHRRSEGWSIYADDAQVNSIHMFAGTDNGREFVDRTYDCDVCGITSRFDQYEINNPENSRW